MSFTRSQSFQLASDEEFDLFHIRRYMIKHSLAEGLDKAYESRLYLDFIALWGLFQDILLLAVYRRPQGCSDLFRQRLDEFVDDALQQWAVIFIEGMNYHECVMPHRKTSGHHCECQINQFSDWLDDVTCSIDELSGIHSVFQAGNGDGDEWFDRMETDFKSKYRHNKDLYRKKIDSLDRLASRTSGLMCRTFLGESYTERRRRLDIFNSMASRLHDEDERQRAGKQ
ncbi:hypothetical protein SUNI508_02353 [Seiridium unicorne]|uniref:Uncharacterized protein n=1 Tax=Seiridium unicorne TaxID=138068 RepID=A0ABR2UIR1_9PEZI